MDTGTGKLMMKEHSTFLQKSGGGWQKDEARALVEITALCSIHAIYNRSWQLTTDS